MRADIAPLGLAENKVYSFPCWHFLCSLGILSPRNSPVLLPWSWKVHSFPNRKPLEILQILTIGFLRFLVDSTRITTCLASISLSQCICLSLPTLLYEEQTGIPWPNKCWEQASFITAYPHLVMTGWLNVFVIKLKSSVSPKCRGYLVALWLYRIFSLAYNEGCSTPSLTPHTLWEGVPMALHQLLQRDLFSSPLFSVLNSCFI